MPRAKPKKTLYTMADAEEPIRRALIPMWKKGQSGNPKGSAVGFYARCRDIARAAAPELMEELVNLAFTAADERVKSVCIIAALDRAGIKAITYDESKEVKSHIDVTLYTPEQRAQLRNLLNIGTSNAVKQAVATEVVDPDLPPAA